MEEVLDKAIKDAEIKGFEEKYGLDPAAVAAAFKDAPDFLTILQHMYLDAMDELRECDISHDGAYVQGQAQVLWTLLDLPNEVLRISQ